MQKVKLPKVIDPVKSANKRSEYSGVMSASDMPRWSEAVAGCNDVIHVEAKFEKTRRVLLCFTEHSIHQRNLSANVVTRS